MMIDVGLIASRFLHYISVTVLAGVSMFPLYAYAAAEPVRVRRWRQRVRLAAAVGALLSGLLWFVFTVANMSGALADVIDLEIIWTVVRNTGFGGVWSARLVLAIITVGLIWNRFDTEFDSRRGLITPVLAAVLLVSLAGVGHSQIDEGLAGIIHVVSDAAHLLAAGAWLGGLVPLGYLLLLHRRETAFAQQSELNGILLRFSGMGYIAVTILIGSGLINSWFLIGKFSGLFATPYGKLLIVKLVFFCGMLVLAVWNRFWLVPSLAKGGEDDRGGRTASAGTLRNHVLSEQFLGLMVLLVVSALGTMRPAIGQ